MIEKILHYIGGIEQYGIASMCLFGSIFIGVLIWAFLQKKSHLDYMARVALDPEPEEADGTGPGASTLDPNSHE
jgi:cbb3-type cytochrome oxidase subunit 3